MTGDVVSGRDMARRWLPLLAAVGAAALVVLVPLLALARTALEEGSATLLRAVGSALPSIVASLWTSLAATALALLAGGSLALLVERSRIPGRRGLRVAMLLALILPGYVAAVGWLNAYAPGGLVDDLTGMAVPALIGPLGIVIVLAMEAAPLVYLIVSAALATPAEPDVERAARVSGADGRTVLWTVTLPLLRPALVGAGAIAFVLSVTSFGVPAVLGIPAGFTTMTTRIYRDFAFSSDPESFIRALGLAIVLAIGAAALIALSDRRLGRLRAERSGAAAGPVTPAIGEVARWSPARVAGVALAWAVVIVAVAVPLLALAVTALAKAPGLAPLPANWSLDNFREIIDPHTLKALSNSLLLAGVAAIVVVGLGVALVAAQGRPAARHLGALLGVTFALPGSTLAVAVLLAYGVALRDTLLIILVAYLAKFWALGYRPIAASLTGMAADVRRAARVSGADAWTTTRTIVLPIVRPVVLAGGAAVFLFGLHEVTMSSLLYGPGTATLGVVVLDLQQVGDAGPSAALALLLSGLLALLSLPLLRRGGLVRLGW